MCRKVNHEHENLPGVAIRRGQDRLDEYGKAGGQDVKRGAATTRLSCLHTTVRTGQTVLLDSVRVVSR